MRYYWFWANIHCLMMLFHVCFINLRAATTVDFSFHKVHFDLIFLICAQVFELVTKKTAVILPFIVDYSSLIDADNCEITNFAEICQVILRFLKHQENKDVRQ
jgi:hypothetical protein